MDVTLHAFVEGKHMMSSFPIGTLQYHINKLFVGQPIYNA